MLRAIVGVLTDVTFDARPQCYLVPSVRFELTLDGF